MAAAFNGAFLNLWEHPAVAPNLKSITLSDAEIAKPNPNI